ncbi:DUF3626 domain-containing protein [Massilia sp. YIM B02763]|uniref:DUF3626 domain-containing protein n=1 Tax=Massilia sp. YIM B02763 TaxID=3050130 RepID=UPI0025B65DA4|nr:DUF3626 domain-containing protein [Massilia sp. YIM B02763]MDN4054761.1 DUF3626 domain-containing protein [Massilia sp. YIM B02763]
MTSIGDIQARAIAHVAALSGGAALDPCLRVTVNFHPDRLHHGKPVLAVLADDGIYRSQFETGTSNGGLGASPGDARWRWEQRIFGGAYDAADPAERPKYGALDYRRRATGASVRFGSAFLRLRSDVLARCTFCHPDSVFEPEHFGTAQHMDLVARALSAGIDPLDDYIEAHVHGELRLDRDAEALVLDPCYRGTPIEAAARKLPCALEWHPGFRLAVKTLRRHPDYRGRAYVDLGERIARDGWLDPACIGAAMNGGVHDPQDVKKVWHYLARFGDLSRGAGASAS